jgi:hypothetical protein
MPTIFLPGLIMKTLPYALLLSVALLCNNKAISNPAKAEDWNSAQALRQQELALYLKKIRLLIIGSLIFH